MTPLLEFSVGIVMVLMGLVFIGDGYLYLFKKKKSLMTADRISLKLFQPLAGKEWVERKYIQLTTKKRLLVYGIQSLLIGAVFSAVGLLALIVGAEHLFGGL